MPSPVSMIRISISSGDGFEVAIVIRPLVGVNFTLFLTRFQKTCCDPARLQQVFWNLVKNSVKFTPTNGRITMATSNPSPDEIEIRIIDTGLGIEAEKVDKIFHA